MRIVADTNVLVSALVFPGGTPEDVYRHAVTGRVTLIVSPALLLELGRVLSDKFGWSGADAEAAVRELLRSADLVEPTMSVAEIAADPSDDRVLEAAAPGRADAIVSGDRHLLGLASWRGIPIHAPAGFLALLED